MKEIYELSPRKRWRLILLLFSVMFVLLASGMIENYNLQRVNEDVSSLYADRLIPASQIYYITEYLFEKRVILESIQDPEQVDENTLIDQLRDKNDELDSLTTDYYQTYLVKDEAEHVQAFDKNLRNYLQIEAQMIKLLEEGLTGEALGLYEEKGISAFRAVISELNILADVQLRVGQELLQSSRNELGYNKLLYYLRVLVIIAVGVSILVIIRTSQMMHQPDQNFRLN